MCVFTPSAPPFVEPLQLRIGDRVAVMTDAGEVDYQPVYQFAHKVGVAFGRMQNNVAGETSSLLLSACAAR